MLWHDGEIISQKWFDKRTRVKNVKIKAHLKISSFAWKLYLIGNSPAEVESSHWNGVLAGSLDEVLYFSKPAKQPCGSCVSSQGIQVSDIPISSPLYVTLTPGNRSVITVRARARGSPTFDTILLWSWFPSCTQNFKVFKNFLFSFFF